MYGYAQSARFLKHEPCPVCGSKDNLARYEGGSAFCFGCGAYEPGESGFVKSLSELSRQSQSGERRPESDGSNSLLRSCPDDTESGGYPEVVLEWVGKYGLAVPDLIRHHVGWSKSREQLIFRFYGEDKDLVLWQARNFRAGTTHDNRFFTGGTPADVIAAYYSRTSTNTACIVEDCISGICVSHAGIDGIPCFSAAMPLKKLSRIRQLYKNIFVWLDHDKFPEAQKMARQLGMLGVHSRAIFTLDDPKDHALDQIKKALKL